MKKSLALVVFAFFVLAAAVVFVPQVKALGSVQFDPSSLSLNAGDSVVGDNKLMPGLTIGQSEGDDVVYVKTNDSGFAAYGAPNSGPAVVNGCLVKGAGIVDKQPAGEGTTARHHHYVFTFQGKTISEFNAGIADFGDYMPFGACTDNRCSLLMKAFDASNNQVAGDEIFFTTADSQGNGRVSSEYGNMDTAGDACSATAGQPGNSSLTVTGAGITRVEIMFESPSDMDPNIAIQNLAFTPEEEAVPTPTPTPGDAVTPTPSQDPEATPSATPTQDPTPTPGQSNGGDNGGSNTSGNSNTNSGSSSGNSSSTSAAASQHGDVLGATNMANTGVADDIAANAAGVMGALSFAAGLILAKKKTH